MNEMPIVFVTPSDRHRCRRRCPRSDHRLPPARRCSPYQGPCPAVRRRRTSVKADGVWPASCRNMTEPTSNQLLDHVVSANIAAAYGRAKRLTSGSCTKARTAGDVAGAVTGRHLTTLSASPRSASSVTLLRSTPLPSMINAFCTRRHDDHHPRRRARPRFRRCAQTSRPPTTRSPKPEHGD